MGRILNKVCNENLSIHSMNSDRSQPNCTEADRISLFRQSRVGCAVWHLVNVIVMRNALQLQRLSANRICAPLVYQPNTPMCSMLPNIVR